MLRLKFAAEFGLAPQDVRHTPLVWWERWLTWHTAKAAHDALESRYQYRDSKGNLNEAEWQNKYPDWHKRGKWAFEGQDLEGNG